ncbi:MAG TPA: PIN domain-containing protein [Candidatus Acidoferrum sp.]|jgi:predicted nucleic acid-binding protein
MTGPEFLDTNILVYAYDPSHPGKQSIAQKLVRRAAAGAAIISTQVLAEFAVTLLHKLNPPASHEDVIDALDALSPIKLIAPDRNTVRRALDARAQYQIHFWDAMIVASAERARCTRIWSEDLNPSQLYFQIPVQNPFH